MLPRRLTAALTATSILWSYLAPTVAWAQERAQHELVDAPASTSLPDSAFSGFASQKTTQGTGGDSADRVRVTESGQVLGTRRIAGRSSDAQGDTSQGANTSDQGADSSDQESTPDPDAETGEDTSTDPDASVQPLSLPGGADKSGVTSQAISVPKGSGSIQGMGESFSAQLSTGIATFSVPFALPKARGGAQPSLGLSYSSGGGRGPAGQGWSVGVPFIARQTDRGLPTYDDQADWHAEQDHFVFNGGQELVPICTVEGTGCKGFTLEGNEELPAWANNHQYFRARVEGSFLRFFWSPDHRTWRVQDKSGVTMELGVPLDGTGYVDAIERNPLDATEIYKWHLVRQYDQHGADVEATQKAQPAPYNVVLYKYQQDGGQAYLSDIYDTSPAGSPATTDVSLFAHHTHLVWEQRTDPTQSYRTGWLVESNLRLARVEVASKTFVLPTSESRRRVRTYHLGYDSASHISQLTSVQVEGRCSGDEGTAALEGSDTACEKLPPMTFGYTKVDARKIDGSEGEIDLPGYDGFDERITTMSSSPDHSVDEALTDLFDINSDGLPDVLVTAPGLYDDGHAFFENGAAGVANAFGGVTNISVDGVGNADAGTITLKNANVSPLDLDGDGTVNLLHMPLFKEYAVYTPVQKNKLWSWAGRAITTADKQSPKIDWGKDTLDTQVVDVNFDGLVDVVVSTGTQFQTFYSLGRYPNGDGQFGWAKHLGPTSAEIHNDPIATCVPHSGSAVRFSDSDTKLADMNGDGITDIVRIRRGDIKYWPGRGNGVWGAGRRDDCPEGTFGADRHAVMANAPWYSDIQGDTLRIDDVNGDGLDDLVQVRFDAVDVWLNVDGTGWTARHIIDGTPASPSYANRVRLTDINGSGTRDILWGNAETYKFIDVTGGVMPGLLNHVENGLGKSTDIDYSTSTAEMLEAERRAQGNSGCKDVGPWCSKWASKMPTVAHVVKRVTEHDNITIAGRPPASYVTEYDYRDPLFEGRQREFRGFSQARARRIGDANSPTDVSESTFLLGECRDPETGETWDGAEQDHYCAPPDRWRDNPFEALKGLPVITEKHDEQGTYLSTTHNGYTVRTLYTGLDGREVRHAFLSQTNTFLYDTAAASGGSNGPSLPSVVDEGYQGSGVSRAVSLRHSSGYAELKSTTTVDRFGNKLKDEAYGCVGGNACPVASTGIAAEEVITQVTTPQIVAHPSNWLWRTGETFVSGSGSGHDNAQRKRARTTFDTFGRPTKVEAEVLGALALQREHTLAGTVGGWVTQSTTAYDDKFGNPVRSRAPNGRCAEVEYDGINTAGNNVGFALFATGEEIFTNDSGSVENPGTPCDPASPSLSTGASYDHGLGVVTLAVDMNFHSTIAEYDGFGRIVALRKPHPDTGVPAPQNQPSVSISYYLPGTAGLPAGAKHSIIHTRTEDGAAIGDNAYLESYAYVDGFGRTLATLSEADPSDGDGGTWVVGGLVEWDQKSAVAKKYLEFFSDVEPMAFSYASAPTTKYGRQRYDAFGRQVQTFDLDGTITLQSQYHALSTDLWDAADLETGPHHSTYASERKDGHGRTIATTERFRHNGAIQLREVRTMYLPSGEPEVITRVNVTGGGTPVQRWMQYDSLGRMVLNAEPNTSKDWVPAVASTADVPSEMKAWRYLYNAAGDLIGTSDARGCGQNFLYDGAGRIKGEDYVPCEAHHAPYTAPTEPNDAGVEVAYYYDTAAGIPIATPAGFSVANAQGRAVAVLDRASATFSSYDARGRSPRVDMQVAAPNTVDANGVGINRVPSERYAKRWYSRFFTFDAADREVAASTGAESLRGADNQFITELLATGNASAVTTEYSRRGKVKKAGSTYGSLISNIDRTADGLVTSITYGDLAETKTEYLYDERRRVSSVQTYRGPPQSWATNAYTPSPQGADPKTSFQLLLQDEDYVYDVVGNPIEIRDWRNPDEWLEGAQPVTKKIQYDDLNRATRIDYRYPEGSDDWVSPFKDELAHGDDDLTDTRRSKPSPHVQFTSRPLRQTFEYDWLGNTAKTGDDAKGFYDRSLGTIAQGDASKPYQLTHAQIAEGPNAGELWAKYDVAGNLTRLDVDRDGTCLGGTCSQRFEYRWDEVGRLVRARRWDTADNVGIFNTFPTGAPAADLRNLYDAGDQRVLKEAVDAESDKSYAVYLFETLELRGAQYGAYGYNPANPLVPATDYEVSEWTAVPYLLANGVRLARLAYENAASPTVVSLPQPPADTTEAGEVAANPQLHVFFELGDHLGSTSVVLDKATGELVERSTFQGYGATESDYRPERWKDFREDYKFTGKEEDVEVGLQYFGKRFLNPYLGRWVSADPLAVHAPGSADLNVFAYVKGTILISVDPFGLDKIPAGVPQSLEYQFNGPSPNLAATRSAPLKDWIIGFAKQTRNNAIDSVRMYALAVAVGQAPLTMDPGIVAAQEDRINEVADAHLSKISRLEQGGANTADAISVVSAVVGVGTGATSVASRVLRKNMYKASAAEVRVGLTSFRAKMAEATGDRVWDGPTIDVRAPTMDEGLDVADGLAWELHDEMALRKGGGRNRSQVVIGRYDPDAQDAGAFGDQNPLHAEDVAKEAMPNPNAKFTQPIHRKEGYYEVCERCETRQGRGSFVEGTKFETD
jgi:RHS repeat-associated protein